ncbi:unnamed protein product [Darwinula stevensoni]|uniref:START domain-containing protein n=1 Tax=Darwinula stevensoni TaxID=69355 RepID=A0A7R8X8D4_9CRUS|nr:unnamed protein product [Darwinula stevensoni]CAG0889565.1 unnamed protein product [Darwinula stevensoni]
MSMMHPLLLCEEKCGGEGERSLENFRFNLERKDWTLQKHYSKEGITVKSVYDQEKLMYFLFTEAPLDFECDWTFGDMRDHTLEATPEWYSDVKEYSVLERLTDVCWVVHEVLEPKLGGIVASREMLYASHCRKIGDAYFVSMGSTEWPGVEPRENLVRAEVPEGCGLSISPDPSHHTTRTLLRWVFSLDLKIPLVPVSFLLPFHVEACRQFILGLRKHLSARQLLKA